MRPRRFEVLRCLHFIQTTRFHLTRPWAVSFRILGPFGRYRSAQVHWFSIVNSLLIVLFLTVMVAMIMVRNLHRDIVRYLSLIHI